MILVLRERETQCAYVCVFVRHFVCLCVCMHVFERESMYYINYVIVRQCMYINIMQRETLLDICVY